MTRGVKAVGLGLGGAAVVGGALMYTGGTGSNNEEYDVQIQATPREIDEGELVEFVADEAPGAVYRWNFGDQTRETAALEMQEVTHVFANGGSPRTDYNVMLRVGATEVGTTIAVRNLPPTIRSLWRSRPARRGDPVEFEARAEDPGRDDQLTYTWNFGDGDTTQGRRVSHTYEQWGHYDVSVTVADGDGGEDRQTMPVTVGDGFEYTVGGAGTGTQQGWIWVRNRQPASLPNSNLCHLEIRFEPALEGLARLTALPILGLSIAAEGGLRATTYPVVGQHWSSNSTLSPVDLREQYPNMFFAGASAELADPLPNVGPYPSAASFTATAGTVTIDYIDATRIEGSLTRPTVSRVYTSWTLDPTVHPDAQVTHFPLEPIDSSGEPVDRHESPETALEFWDRTEILSVDYYFLTVAGDCTADVDRGCDWSDGEISPYFREAGRQLVLDGAVFTTQNFPVLETQARAMGDAGLEDRWGGALAAPVTWSFVTIGQSAGGVDGDQSTHLRLRR